MVETAERGAGAAPDGAAVLLRFLLPEQGPALRRRDQAVLDAAEPLTVASEGLDLVGYSWGAGPVVALAHGWSSRAGHLAGFVEPLVGAGRRVVSVDMPGHGASPGRLSNLYRFSRALQVLAGQSGGFDAVVAHSGGVLATVMALGEGLAARRVVGLAPMVRLRTAAERFGPGLGAGAEASAGFLGGMVAEFGAEVWDRTAADLVAPRLTVPALLLHDPDDDETPYGESVELAQLWPGARLLPTPGVGHRRILRAPSTIAATLAFLEGDRDGRWRS